MFMDEQGLQDWRWDDLRTVLAIAHSGSLSGAARQLGSSHPTVFRRIRDIENRLDLKLFERSATGYLPTPAGDMVIAAAERMAANVEELDIELGNGDVSIRDRLRITCSDTVYFFILAPLLSQFRQLYPDVTLEVAVTGDFVNLQRHDADVALRVSRRASEHLHGVKLAEFGLGVHAHKDRAAAMTRPVVLNEHDWIGFDESMTYTGVARFMVEHGLEPSVVFRVNSLIACCEAVKQNIGLGVMPYYAGAALDDVVCLEDVTDEVRTELWAVSMPAMRRRPAIRALFSYLEESIAPLQPMLLRPA